MAESGWHDIANGMLPFQSVRPENGKASSGLTSTHSIFLFHFRSVTGADLKNLAIAKSVLVIFQLCDDYMV